MGLTYSLDCGEPSPKDPLWDRNVKNKWYLNIFFRCFIHIELNMYVLFNWRGVKRERYLDYIKLNYLSYSYKGLNPGAILYLHTSLNHLVLSNLNTFHIITLHSQSSLLKPSHWCHYHNKNSHTTLRLTAILPTASGWRPVFAHRTSRLPNSGSSAPAKSNNSDRSGNR